MPQSQLFKAAKEFLDKSRMFGRPLPQQTVAFKALEAAVDAVQVPLTATRLADLDPASMGLPTELDTDLGSILIGIHNARCRFIDEMGHDSLQLLNAEMEIESLRLYIQQIYRDLKWGEA